MKKEKKRVFIALIEMMGKASVSSAIVALITGVIGYILCIILDVSEKKEFDKRVADSNNRSDSRRFMGRPSNRNQSW